MKISGSPEIELQTDESIDEFMDGRLRLIQSRTGYRFSIDAILLAEFVTVRKGDIIVDLGTGCGVIPLILLLQRSFKYIFGMDIQKELVLQASRNADLNGLSRKMGVIMGDVRHPPLVPSFADVVTCNPPYRRKESGRINPNQQRAIARHEILMSLDDILGIAKYILKAKGCLAVIYPADRLVEMITKMRQAGMEPKRVRVIYPDMESQAKLVLVEAVLDGGIGLKILPPLVDQGEYSIRYQA